MRVFILFMLVLFASDFTPPRVRVAEPEPAEPLTLVFMGDIMGHGPQIAAAYDEASGTYRYDDVFRKVSPIFRSADFAIANLEVTLAGEPYTGYPMFSSPDALAEACLNSGIQVLVTANNHSCDKRKKGILRTIRVLDSLGIRHTGTFRDSFDRDTSNLLVLEKNDIRVGLLNYTYGTNGMPIPPPTVVNLIDTVSMLADIRKSQTALLDKLIVAIHWGDEYRSLPSPAQQQVADFLFRNGVDIIVGSHPHVLQPMQYIREEGAGERLVAWSLGNFVSNQRKRKTDGGAILRLTLTRGDDGVHISHAGHYLTWVHRFLAGGKQRYEIIPCSVASPEELTALDSLSRKSMDLFLADSRELFRKKNVGMPELTEIHPPLEPVPVDTLLEQWSR